MLCDTLAEGTLQDFIFRIFQKVKADRDWCQTVFRQERTLGQTDLAGRPLTGRLDTWVSVTGIIQDSEHNF